MLRKEKGGAPRGIFTDAAASAALVLTDKDRPAKNSSLSCFLYAVRPYGFESLLLRTKKIAPSRGWCYFLARPEGFEPPTFTFVVCYSIQLSYGRIIYLFLENKVDYITFIASLSKEKFVSCGMIIVVLVPISLRLITSIVPLCLSMIHFIIARPRPEPPVFRARDSSER